jgi:hypothetical protein
VLSAPWRVAVIAGATALGWVLLSALAYATQRYVVPDPTVRIGWPAVARLHLGNGVVWALLSALASVFPVSRRDWWRRIPLHVAGAVGVVALQLALRRVLELAVLGAPIAGVQLLVVMVYDFVVYTAILALVHRVRGEWQAADEERRLVEIEREVARASLALVRRRLQPAFLFQQLDALSAAAATDPARAETLVVRLADFLRLVLQVGAHATVPLGQDAELLAAYERLVALRSGGTVLVPAHDLSRAAHDVPVPAMLLQRVAAEWLEAAAPLPPVFHARVVGGTLRIALLSPSRVAPQLLARVVDCVRGSYGEECAIDRSLVPGEALTIVIPLPSAAERERVAS